MVNTSECLKSGYFFNAAIDLEHPCDLKMLIIKFFFILFLSWFSTYWNYVNSSTAKVTLACIFKDSVKLKNTLTHPYLHISLCSSRCVHIESIF